MAGGEEGQVPGQAGGREGPPVHHPEPCAAKPGLYDLLHQGLELTVLGGGFISLDHLGTPFCGCKIQLAFRLTASQVLSLVNQGLNPTCPLSVKLATDLLTLEPCALLPL